MVVITLAQIAKYRSALSTNTEALSALDMIEDCEGDLEDAAISLALKVGQEPDRSDNWLDGLAKRWRTILCKQELRAALEADDLSIALSLLTEYTTLSSKLAVPVLIYVLETGITGFCQPLDERL